MVLGGSLANDILICPSQIVMLGRYVVELLLILLCGMGLHADEVDRTGGPEAFVRFKKVSIQQDTPVSAWEDFRKDLIWYQLTYIGELLWATVLGLTQLSILQYYLRRLQQRLAMRLSYAGMGLCSALWIASSLATAFICTPSRKVWLASLEGDCGNRNKLHTGCAVSGLILNVFILLLPLPVIRNMQLTWPKKVWLAIIYILGLVWVFICFDGRSIVSYVLMFPLQSHWPLCCPNQDRVVPYLRRFNLWVCSRLSFVQCRDFTGYNRCMSTSARTGQSKDQWNNWMHIDSANSKVRSCR